MGAEAKEEKTLLGYKMSILWWNKVDSLYGDLNIKALFMEIVGKLERIEEKLDETTYLQEEFFKSDFVERVKAAEKDISDGKYLEFESMDDFLDSVETWHTMSSHTRKFRRTLKSYTGKIRFAMHIWKKDLKSLQRTLKLVSLFETF